MGGDGSRYAIQVEATQRRATLLLIVVRFARLAANSRRIPLGHDHPGCWASNPVGEHRLRQPHCHPRAIIAVVALATAPAAYAAPHTPQAFYVSAGGSDTAPGTQARPWKTLGRANRQRFQAGDALLLQGGHTFAGGLVFNASSNGTAAAPIHIASWSRGRATIFAGTGDGIRITNAGGYAIENLVIKGAGVRTNSGVGVFFHSTRRGSAKFDYALVRNVDVSGFLTAGVQFAADDLYGFSNVTVDRVNAHDNGRQRHLHLRPLRPVRRGQAALRARERARHQLGRLPQSGYSRQQHEHRQRHRTAKRARGADRLQSGAR